MKTTCAVYFFARDFIFLEGPVRPCICRGFAPESSLFFIEGMQQKDTLCAVLFVENLKKFYQFIDDTERNLAVPDMVHIKKCTHIFPGNGVKGLNLRALQKSLHDCIYRQLVDLWLWVE